MAGKRARGCSTQISAVQRLSTRARWPVSVGGFACARRREMPRMLRAAQENPAEAFASEALASARACMPVQAVPEESDLCSTVASARDFAAIHADPIEAPLMEARVRIRASARARLPVLKSHRHSAIASTSDFSAIHDDAIEAPLREARAKRAAFTRVHAQAAEPHSAKVMATARRARRHRSKPI